MIETFVYIYSSFPLVELSSHVSKLFASCYKLNSSHPYFRSLIIVCSSYQLGTDTEATHGDCVSQQLRRRKPEVIVRNGPADDGQPQRFQRRFAAGQLDLVLSRDTA